MTSTLSAYISIACVNIGCVQIFDFTHIQYSLQLHQFVHLHLTKLLTTFVYVATAEAVSNTVQRDSGPAKRIDHVRRLPKSMQGQRKLQKGFELRRDGQ